VPLTKSSPDTLALALPRDTALVGTIAGERPRSGAEVAHFDGLPLATRSGFLGQPHAPALGTGLSTAAALVLGRVVNEPLAWAYLEEAGRGLPVSWPQDSPGVSTNSVWRIARLSRALKAGSSCRWHPNHTLLTRCTHAPATKHCRTAFVAPRTLYNRIVSAPRRRRLGGLSLAGRGGSNCGVHNP